MKLYRFTPGDKIRILPATHYRPPHLLGLGRLAETSTQKKRKTHDLRLFPCTTPETAVQVLSMKTNQSSQRIVTETRGAETPMEPTKTIKKLFTIRDDMGEIAHGLDRVSADNALLRRLAPAKPPKDLALFESTQAGAGHFAYTITCVEVSAEDSPKGM